MTPEMLTTLTEQVAELVQTYSNNYPQFQRATYNETQVRVDFVNRFFKLLGWDVDNERGLPQHLREVTHEATVVVEEDGVHRNKKPDYSFKVGTEVLYFLETKKPAVNLTIDAAPAFQLRRYGWSGNLKVSVLTNFTDLYIYDCSVRPREGDDIGIAMIAHYHFDEYVERFEEIYNMLSKEAVLTGQFERHFGNIQGALRREPFDQYFLDQIRTWRMMLGEDILCNNPNVDAETLNIFVQRVLNRTIFLRICEDRCFENYESLKAITTYQDLRTMFAAADQKYDSGLFELLEEDRLTVSDSVIIEIFQSLYYPNNSYEFGVIDPYIIGQIYELFLDEALVIREDGHIETQEKPEVVDSQGAVNTPKNITDIIIEETLRPLYENRTPEEVAQYRIADICCGSGNFLLSAFEYIVNYHIEYIRVQNMVHYSREEYDFYKSNHSPYVTAQTDTLDKYYLFIEKGLTLLNDGGMLGYIVPHKFMNIKSGAKLRELLSSNSSVKKILHFGTHQVFENRSTYTCILVLSKQGHEEFQIGFVQDWNRFLFNHDTECLTYPAAYISGQPWSFLPQNIVAHLEEISQSCVPLSSLVDIFVGVQTSADQIYIIHADREDDNFIYSHDRQGREFQIEKGILRKSIYDTQLVCYEKIKANSYIIFPYKSVNGRPVLYSLDEMTTDFPHALAYLNSFKNKLDERNMPGRTTENWFAFGRSQSLKRFLAGEHLVWPVLSTSSNYVYDNDMVVFTGGGNGPFYGIEKKVTSQESIFYIQAILNHWLMELLVKSRASTFRGDYYSHGKQFIATLPIYKIDFENPTEVARHQRIVEMVQNIMQLKEQLASAPNAARCTVLEHSITAINAELNIAIDELYQVESQEVEEQV